MKIGKSSTLYTVCILGFVGAELIAVKFYKASQAKQNLSGLIVNVRSSDVFLRTRPTVGNLDAPVRLVVFGDYQCPPCRLADEQLLGYVQKHPAMTCLQFRNNPLTSIHPLAQQAALCVEESDTVDGFWKLHKKLYDNQDLLSSKMLNEMSLKKADPVVRKRIEAAKTRIGQDVAFARSENLNATPTIFVVTGKTVFKTAGYPVALRIAEMNSK